MKQIKIYLSSLIPLFIIMFSLTIALLTSRIFQNFQEYVKKDYSIIVISKYELDLKDFKVHSKLIKSYKQVSTKKIMEDVENNLSKWTAILLSRKVPNFYRIYFNKYPTHEELLIIKKSLLISEKISRVDVLKNIHQQTYRFLFFISMLVYIFTVLIAITSFFLIKNEVEIWFHQHKRRMEIMKIFGATVMMRSADLRKVAFINSFLVTFLVIGSILLIKNTIIKYLATDLEFVELIYTWDIDLVFLIITTLIISHLPVFMVVYSKK